jgi:hypothetical protein
VPEGATVADVGEIEKSKTVTVEVVLSDASVAVMV